MKIYIICEAHSLNILETIVNEKIEMGYIPIGGIGVATYGNYSVTTIYSQAMILKKEGDNIK